MGQADNVARTTIGTRFSFGARPTIGASAALKAVVQDTSQLVRAELDLAKAELTAGIKANATGIAMLVAAGATAWLAVQALLILIGFLLALVMPAWLSVAIITVVLVIVAVILGLIATRKLKTPISVEQAKSNVQEDVAWFKTHLRAR